MKPTIVPETPLPSTSRDELWSSDAIARMLQALDVPWVALVPGASFRGLHDSLVNHIGTHVDLPSHQIADGATLDEIPLESLVADAVTLDLSGREPGPVGWSELEPLLADLRKGDWLFLYSDNGRNWRSDDYWTGWSYPDAEASRALVDRGIVGIGFDGPSADPVDTETFDLHKVWLGAGRMILENLTNLGLLPARTQVVVAPLKVRAANGAPARVLAFVPD